MTNFIFKSPSDLQKISQSLKLVLTELKHQRSDLAYLKILVLKCVNNDNLQKTVDDFYKNQPGVPYPQGSLDPED